ncbi:C40 family peptidase [Nocardioides stalactiti]|uniref:C40 family peptidase n=1 Tax=Nocardioides stalactiti TaxID=2755356 RepID=UPI0016023635|nr:NlpC/P60 family protein [Nocardioides stalactiti]
MLNGHKRITTTLSALALTASVCLAVSSSGPAQAEPDIDDVRARVDRLFQEAEQAQERYHDAKLELEELNDELESLQSDEVRQGDTVAAVRSDVRDSVIRQFQGQTLGPAAELLNADEDAFLNELSTFTTVGDLQASLLSDYNDELKAYAIRRKETADRRDQVADIEAELQEEKETVDDKLAEAEDLLDELEAKEREAILSRDSDTRAPSSVPAEGRAAAAVNFLMSQVGDAYVFGAAGPSAWDCSGLTMVAWAQAGVSLPHSSSAQFGSGTRVAESDLQPGDLVFYYSPISHVEMYIGNGLIAGAANPGAGVRVADLHSMPYVGAVRPG